jgi:hypothetical protein
MPYIIIISIALPIHPIRKASITIQKPVLKAGDAVKATRVNDASIKTFQLIAPPNFHAMPAKLLKNSAIELRTAAPNNIGSQTAPTPDATHGLHQFAPVPIKITYRNKRLAMNLRTFGHAVFFFADVVFLGMFSQYKWY